MSQGTCTSAGIPVTLNVTGSAGKTWTVKLKPAPGKGPDVVVGTGTGNSSFNYTIPLSATNGAPDFTGAGLWVFWNDDMFCPKDYFTGPANCCISSVTASNDGSKCQGQTVTLSAIASNINGSVSYNWTGPAGFTASGQSVTTTVAGTYTVKIADVYGCQATATTTVVINPLPSANPTSNNEVCDGQQFNLKANPTGGTPGYTFVWAGPNFNSTVQNPNVTSIYDSSNGTYVVTVTDSKGCKAIGQIGLKTKPLPVITIAANSPCAGSAINLTASATFVNHPSSTVSSYAWTGPNGFTSSVQNPTIASGDPATNNGPYTVVVTSNFGCTKSATVTVTVKPNPVATINTNVGTNPVCVNTNITFSAADAGAGATYTWEFGAGATPATASGIGPHNVTYSTCSTRDIKLMVTLNGCITTTTKTVDRKSVV